MRLNADGKVELEKRHDALLRKSRGLSPADIAEGQTRRDTRLRARSVDQYRTARKFSLARERQRTGSVRPEAPLAPEVVQTSAQQEDLAAGCLTHTGTLRDLADDCDSGGS